MTIDVIRQTWVRLIEAICRTFLNFFLQKTQLKTSLQVH